MSTSKYQGYNKLKAAMKKAGFDKQAKSYQAKAGQFMLTFGNTRTYWETQIREDFESHTIKLVDKTFFPEFFSDSDKKEYEAFKEWTFNFRLTVKN